MNRFLIVVSLLLAGSGTLPAAAPQRSAELFNLTNVWDVHLRFTPEQWAAIEPKQPEGGGFPFGGPPGRGPGGPGRPGGPGGPGGPGRMAFNPVVFVAPGFFAALDGNSDKDLTKDEFVGGFDRWFKSWDTNNTASLDEDKIRAGLNKALSAGGPGGPPGFPGGPGGPGGGGGDGRASWLQGREGGRNGLSAARGIEFSYVHADLEFQGQVITNVAVRYKGNGTFMETQGRGLPKKSFKLDLNDFVKGQKLGGVSKLNLHNDITDASWMNEVLSHKLYRDAGVPAPRTSYARVTVTVPGTFEAKYFGLYSMVENPDENWAETNFSTKKGAILKPVTSKPFDYLGDDWKKYRQIYDPKTDLTPAQAERVIAFARLVTKAEDSEFTERLGDFLDLDQFARYMAVTVYLSTLDSILSVGQNYFVYLHPKSNKFVFAPWDLDHAFGQFGLQGSQDQREGLSIHHPWQGENRFLDRVFKVEAFKKLYLAKLSEFSESIFKPQRFHEQVDLLAGSLRPAVKDESEVALERFNKVVAGEAVPPNGFGPPPGAGGGGGGRPPGGFGGPGFGMFQPPKPIKPFVVARSQSVIDQLSGKSPGQELRQGFGPGGPGGNRGGFGPGMFLAKPVFDKADGDKDGKVSATEFHGLGEAWFARWDAGKKGHLDEGQVREGLSAEFPPPPGIGPPPGGGGPGGGPPPPGN